MHIFLTPLHLLLRAWIVNDFTAASETGVIITDTNTDFSSPEHSALTLLASSPSPNKGHVTLSYVCEQHVQRKHGVVNINDCTQLRHFLLEQKHNRGAGNGGNGASSVLVGDRF